MSTITLMTDFEYETTKCNVLSAIYIYVIWQHYIQSRPSPPRGAVPRRGSPRQWHEGCWSPVRAPPAAALCRRGRCPHTGSCQDNPQSCLGRLTQPKNKERHYYTITKGCYWSLSYCGWVLRVSEDNTDVTNLWNQGTIEEQKCRSQKSLLVTCM